MRLNVNYRFLLFIIFLVVFLLIFSLRDYFLKVYLTRYLQRNFFPKVHIEKAKFTLTGVQVEGFKGEDREFKFAFWRATLDFYFSLRHFFKPSHIKVEKASLKIKGLGGVKKAISKFGNLGGHSRRKAEVVSLPFPLSVDLEKVRVKLEKVNHCDLDINFSFKGEIENGYIPSIHKWEVFDGSFYSSNLKVIHLRIKKHKGNIYVLSLPKIVIRDREIKDTTIFLEPRRGKMVISQIETPLLGEIAWVKGELNWEDYRSVCLHLNLGNISFKNVMEVVTKRGEMDSEGFFEGKVEFCFSSGRFPLLRVNLYNNKGGTIRINKQPSFDFLRRYLKEETYNYLIDNLRNYRYNKGEISIFNQDKVLILKVNFSSQKMGERNIIVNFHKQEGER